MLLWFVYVGKVLQAVSVMPVSTVAFEPTDFDFDFFCTLAGHDCSSLGIESRLWVRVIKDGNMVDLTLVLGDRRQFV